MGNYQIAFYFSIWTKDQGQITDCQADTSYGLSTQDIPHYILRVREPESPCDTIIETFPPDTTGIHDKGKPELRSRITSLHPTPFTQSAQVHVHIEDPARYELTIWNMLGEEVRQRAITLERGQNRFHIKRGELTNGVYLLTIANRNGNGNKRLSQQFVINSD